MSSNPVENTNVDSNEIEKFNSIAESWWDMEGNFKPLHKLKSGASVLYSRND